MSHGKASARDLRYGRRGGGWAEEPRDKRSIEQIKADTLAAGGTWPGESDAEADAPSLFDEGGVQ